MAKPGGDEKFIDFINKTSNPFCFLSFYSYFMSKVEQQVEVCEFIICFLFIFKKHFFFP
jgi:hypothetical protein